MRWVTGCQLGHPFPDGPSPHLCAYSVEALGIHVTEWSRQFRPSSEISFFFLRGPRKNVTDVTTGKGPKS